MSRASEVAVFVFRGESSGQVLLLRRSVADGGYWHVVAGRVEHGEDAEAAAARELEEETGLVASLGPSCEVIEHATPDGLAPAPAGRTTGVRVTCFVATAPAAWVPTLNEEHDAFSWRPWPAAADALLWPETAQALRTLARS